MPTTERSLEIFLKQRLKQPLPGFQAQRAMGPRRPDNSLTHEVPPPEDCRKNAVMLLLYPDDKSRSHRIILTVRSDALPSHAGEISCPGGGLEPGETPLEAAYRETDEEIGIPREAIRFTGTLSPLYIPITNNLIYPHLGFLHSKPGFRINPDEVREILTPKISDLAAADYLKEEQWKIRENDLHVPYWNMYDIPIWGATAMILSELIEITKNQTI